MLCTDYQSYGQGEFGFTLDQKRLYIGTGAENLELAKANELEALWKVALAEKLGAKAIGSIVKVAINGTARNFIVVHQGVPSTLYDASCDGTWLLMEDVYESGEWTGSNINTYSNSSIHSYLNSTFLSLFESGVSGQIKEVRLPYCAGNATGTVYGGATGLLTKVFLLAAYEVGFSALTTENLPADGALLSYFIEGNEEGSAARAKRIAYLNSTRINWWLRSPWTNTTDSVVGVSGANSAAGGSTNLARLSQSIGIRPAFILTSSLLVDDSGIVFTASRP